MIEVEINERDATFVVDPDHGRRVVFEVRWRYAPTRRMPGGFYAGDHERFVVGLQGSEGAGFSTHTDFEKACRSALYRARRYERAFSKPHGVLRALAGAA